MDGARAGRHHAHMDLRQLLLVMGVFVLAGGVKGVTGMGLPTVAMSLLGLWMTPVQAAAVLVVPSLATNLAQCRGPYLPRLAGDRHRDCRRTRIRWHGIDGVRETLAGCDPHRLWRVGVVASGAARFRSA